MLLKDKVAVITGGAGINGLGFATARMMAEQGAKVAILDLAAADPQAAAARLGEGHLGLVANVTDKASCEAAVAEIQARYGRIDILVNNAGVTQPVKFLDITGGDYDRILDVSLRGTLYASQAVLPVMLARQGGSIVCLSSVSAQRGGGILGGPHYSAAKAGVLGLARAMAREYGGSNIRVNCVTPGLIATDINKGKIPEDKRQDILDGIPLGRIGEPNDVAGCIVFLASDLSKYCTGVTLDVNGGMLIH
jgi:NAD(P)-dependent dehydrogenase (short-subunit alcohol dehydrogenase family)